MRKKKTKSAAENVRKRATKKSKNLAFREFDSVFFNERVIPLEFQQFVEQKIWLLLTALRSGYKQDEKRQVATHCLHNLIEAGLTNRVVADSRNKGIKGISQRVAVWDVIIQAGLCRICKGSEDSGRVSLYHATDKLLNLRQRWELELLEHLHLKRNTEEIDPTRLALVVLYAGKKDWLTGLDLPEEKRKQPLSIVERITATAQRKKENIHEPDPQAIKNGMDYTRAAENSMNAINSENLRHSFIAFSLNPETGNQNEFGVNVQLRQVHSGGHLFRCVRLYSWGPLSGQNLAQEQRQTMLIDDEPAAEFDSHCNAIRMLYHLSGIDERGDVYWPEKVFKKYYQFSNTKESARKLLRDFVKLATNICLNVSSEKKAFQALSKNFNKHKYKTFLQKAIKTENADLKIMLKRVINVHPEKVQKRLLNNGDLRLTTMESNIMHAVLREFVVNQKRPALAIHDSMVVKTSDIEEAMSVFREKYQETLLFEPVLRRKF